MRPTPMQLSALIVALTAGCSDSDGVPGGWNTGGVSTGGAAAATGGAFGTGGATASGGAAFGTGGFATGGFATGGFATGGFATGGGDGDPTSGGMGNDDPTSGGTGNDDPTSGGTGNDDPTSGGTGNDDPGSGGSNGDPGSGGTGGGNPGSGGTGGGNPGSGECTNIRPTGTEWDEATCDQWASQTPECNQPWMIENNYCNESCGRCSSNGSGGSGGGGPGPIPSMCTEPSGNVCSNQIGTHCGYTFEYWKDQGTGCMTNTADGFSVEWSNINNLLGRKGVRPGSASNVVHYNATYNPNGNSYLCVYGWTTGPLVEYYIVDSWGNWRPPGGEGYKGSFQSDGGTYDIYQTQRVNQPSIEGTATFYQYWSVRTEKRVNGTITVGNHFNAWAQHGMNMGNLYEVSMTVEGYQSSGSATVSMSIE